MNKKILMFMLPLFAISLVVAAYMVSSFVITTDIQEPFTVQYVIIGDAGNYVEGESETCENYTGTWNDGINVDVGGLYAGESRLICTKITNAGEGEVVSGLGNLDIINLILLFMIYVYLYKIFRNEEK